MEGAKTYSSLHFTSKTYKATTGVGHAGPSVFKHTTHIA